MIWVAKGESSLQDTCLRCGHVRAAHPFHGRCVDCLRFGYGFVCVRVDEVKTRTRVHWRSVILWTVYFIALTFIGYYGIWGK